METVYYKVVVSGRIKGIPRRFDGGNGKPEVWGTDVMDYIRILEACPYATRCNEDGTDLAVGGEEAPIPETPPAPAFDKEALRKRLEDTPWNTLKKIGAASYTGGRMTKAELIDAMLLGKG